MVLLNATSINIAVLVSVVSLVGGGMAAFLRVRGATRDAIESQADKRVAETLEQADHWRESFQAENVRANQLAVEAKEQRELKHAALADVASLKMRTDLSGLMKQLTDSFTAIHKRIDSVEQRFDDRMTAFLATQEAQTKVLQAIEKRLNERRPV